MMELLPQVVQHRLIVFDPHCEYTDHRLLRCETIDDFQFCMAENYSEKSWAVVWTPKSNDEIPRFLAICYEMRDVWLIIEECNISHLGNVRDPDPNFINLVNFGRNRNISMIAVAKRPAQVTRDLTSQADIIISFRQDEPNDIKYLQEFCGRDVDRQVRNLGDHDWRIVYPNIEADGNYD